MKTIGAMLDVKSLSAQRWIGVRQERFSFAESTCLLWHGVR